MSDKNFNPNVLPSANELDRKKLDDRELMEREKRERAAYSANSAANAITSLTQGQMPSNYQIQSALNNAQDTITQVQKSGQLTTEGGRLAQETRQVVQDVQQIIAERNQDEQFQQFAEASINLAKEGSQNAQLQQLQQGWNTDKYAERSRRLLSNSKIFARTLVRDQEFRVLIRDTIALLGDMVGDTSFVQNIQQKASQMTGGFIQPPRQQQSFGGQNPMMLYNQRDRPIFIENAPSNVYSAERSFIPSSFGRKDWNRDWDRGFDRDFDRTRNWDFNERGGDWNRSGWNSGNDWNLGRKDWNRDWDRGYDRDFDRTRNWDINQRSDWNRSDWNSGNDWNLGRRDWNRDWDRGYDRDFDRTRNWDTNQRGGDWNRSDWDRDFDRNRNWSQGGNWIQGSQGWNQGNWNQGFIQQSGGTNYAQPYWNTDKRQEVFNRLVLLLKKAAAQPEWHGAIDALLDLTRDIRFDLTRGQPGMAAQQTYQGIASSQHSTNLQSSGRKIIESFSHRSLDQFIYLAQLTSVQIRENNKLVYAIKELKTMVLEILKKPDLLDNQEYNQRLNLRFNDVWYQMKYLKDSVYFRGMLQEGNQIINNITSDPLLQKLQNDTTQLMNHLLRDSSGNLKLNSALFDEVKSLLVPIMMEQLRYVPVPRITDQVHTPLGLYDVIIDNLVFSAYDVVPDRFKVKVYNNLDLNLKGLSLNTNNASSVIKFKLTDIQTHMKDIKLFYKKAGAANYSSSLLDIHTGKRGMKVIVEVLMHKNQPIFATQRVYVKIDKLKLKMHGSKMDFLFNLMLTLTQGRIRKTVEQKIEDNLVKIIGNMNTAMNHAIEKVPSPSTITSSIPNILPSIGSKKDNSMIQQQQGNQYISSG